jgi:phosphate-selective porin
MFVATETTEQQDRALAELLELGMAAAREVQARLLAAEDAKAVCDLSLAFNRVSRSVRQTVALQAKVGRERRREGRDAAAEIKRADEAHASRRQLQLRTAVERRIWTEAEGDEAERLIDELDDLVSEEALCEGFGREPVAAHIARICTDLGLPDPPLSGEAAGQAAERACATDSPPQVPSGHPQPPQDTAFEEGETAWRSSA